MCRIINKYLYWLLFVSGVAVVIFTTPLLAAPSGQSTPTATPQQYTVQAGETLSQIAQAFEVPMPLLMAANGIPNPNAIYVGQALTIPDPNAPTPTPLPLYHFVARGDTLSQIAARYDVTIEALIAANDLDGPTDLQFGQELLIPSATNPPPTVASTLTPSATLTPTLTLSTTPQATITATLATVTATMSPAPSATVIPVEIVDPATPPLPPPGAEPRSHLVQPGETASQIAQTFAVDLADLLRVNNIFDPDTIVVGQKLLIPETPIAPTSAPITATTAPSSIESAQTSQANEVAEATPPKRRAASLNRSITALGGDTPAHIALRAGVDAEALRRLNHFESIYTTLPAGAPVLLPATQQELFAVPELPAANYYTVQSGDTLSAIAAVHDLTLGFLMRANRIDNPDAIAIGDRLIIPEPAATYTETQSSEVESEFQRVGPGRSGYFYYTVRPGDTARSLAIAFNTNENAIRDYNNFPNTDTIFLGMQIRIPYGVVDLPVRTPPAPTSGTSFIVSVSRQECWLFWGKRIIRTWICSTGHGDYKTHLGNFKVQSKIEMARSTGYQLDMPYWLGIYNVGYYENGIHGLPIDLWDGKKVWEGLVGQPATYGCAMLNDEDAAELFHMAYIGMPVYIIK